MKSQKDNDQQTTTSPAAVRQKTGRNSLIGVIVALLSLAALGWLAWTLTHQPAQDGGGPGRAGPGGGRPGGPPMTTVGVATVEQTALPVIVDALGTVTATATAVVRPQVSGVLQKIHFREGETVKAGQLLATIDPRQFEMALMQATGQRRRDEAQLENARLTLERFRTLLAQDSIARQEVDTQAALVQQLEGTVIADRAAEGTARLNLGYTKVNAPIGGRVGLRAADVGNVIGPNDANGIVVITQTEPIDVEFAVPQDRIGELRARINEGAALPVEAFDRSRTKLLDSGRFLAMNNQVDVQTGTVRAKARFTNGKHALFPSQFVNVRLQLQTIEGALTVPVTALRHGGDGDYVYVLNAAERTVALRPVQRGLMTADKVQIVSGLKAGEQVITEGADRLKDGARVNLPGERPANGQGGQGRRSGKPDAAAAPQGAAQDGVQGGGQRPAGERPRGAGTAQ